MKNIINTKALAGELIDYTRQPMFLGEDLGIQRYDIYKHKIFYKNFQDQLSNFWRPEEVSLLKDRADFLDLPEEQRRIFTNNLKYQILLDSVQSRGIPFLQQYVSLPELEATMKVWEMMETLHSYSYTYLIKNVYPNPNEVFDSILLDPFIVERAKVTTSYYDTLIGAESDPKKDIFLSLINIYILEGIRFYVSFACAYAFAENKTMEGNAKIISLINRDENLHLAITQNILNFMRKEDSEGFKNMFERFRLTILDMFEVAAMEEAKWAEYIFQDGSMLGLNAELLSQYMKWLTNKRMRAIGLPSLFEGQPNPLGWINNWTNSKKVQVAPQETEISNYRVGSTKADIGGAFDGFN